jgi:maltose-binding protein MalE
MKTRTPHASRRELLKLPASAAGAVLPSPCVGVAALARSAGKKPTTITYMIWGGPERAKFYVDAFNRFYPETAEWLKVEVVSPGKQDAESYQALRLALAAGGQGLPDLIMMNYIGVPEFAAAGALLDLGQLMAPYAGQFVPGAKVLASYDGKYVGVPMQIKAKLWYYRKVLCNLIKLSIDALRVCCTLYVKRFTYLRDVYPTWVEPLDPRSSPFGMSPDVLESHPAPSPTR